MNDFEQILGNHVIHATDKPTNLSEVSEKKPSWWKKIVNCLCQARKKRCPNKSVESSGTQDNKKDKKNTLLDILNRHKKVVKE